MKTLKHSQTSFVNSCLLLVALCYLAIFLSATIYRGYVQGNKAIREVYGFVVSAVAGEK